MSKKEELHRFDNKTETTKVRRTSSGDIVIDSYFGNVEDPENHDRLSLNVTKGTLSGHGPNHSDRFDTGKDNSKQK